MSEIKPCPFCGGEAITIQEHGWWVVCTDCSAEVGFEGMTDTSGCYGSYQTEAEAIEAWNSRAERTCKFVSSKGSDYPPVCSACGYELAIYDCAWYEDGTYGYERNYCPNCGAKVVSE